MPFGLVSLAMEDGVKERSCGSNPQDPARRAVFRKLLSGTARCSESGVFSPRVVADTHVSNQPKVDVRETRFRFGLGSEQIIHCVFSRDLSSHQYGPA